MKTFSSIFLFTLIAVQIPAQDKYANTYVCTKGKIHFYSGTGIEDIDANTNSAVCVLNTQTRKVNAIIKHSTFILKYKMMQEHYNDQYMESDKYPLAVLDMIMDDHIDQKRDGIYEVTLKGTLEMRGVKQVRLIKGRIVIKNGQPSEATASFVIKLADFKIEIPSIAGVNITEEVTVDVHFDFEKYIPLSTFR